MTLYRVHWKATATGWTGHGEKAVAKQVAQAWAERENKAYDGQIEHWIEPVPNRSPQVLHR